MATFNEEYRDAALRHAIGLRRYSAGVTRKVASLLERADLELTQRLRTKLAAFEGQGRRLDFTGERWKAVLADIRGARAVAIGEYRTMVRDELGELAVAEGAREVSLLSSSVPLVEVDFAAVSATALRTIATSRPFNGKLLKEWFDTFARADLGRITSAVQLGMVQGEPINDIVRRVIGTRKNKYADGVAAVTRRDAQTLVRTAVNHVSNEARAAVWEENRAAVPGRVWVSTLDGRTSLICAARDGHVSVAEGGTLPEGVTALEPNDAQPPAHPNCRSTMVAYIDGIGLLGKRPYVTDTRTRAKREVDFRKLAKEQGISVQDVRRDWAQRNVGQIPAKVNYNEFLGRQSAKFQDEVLGPTKGKLFREGGLKMDHFVDRRGNELSLAELRATRPEAFAKAGLAE